MSPLIGISKPYFKIYRSGIGAKKGNQIWCFADKDYANDRLELCRSYLLIENDLRNLLEYIEPADINLKSFSHRTYELFLRACTEMEMNCKGILSANGYVRTSRGNMNIEDYYKIDQATKISEYQIIFKSWRSGRKVFQPFKEWRNPANQSQPHVLSWYQSYNDVKHNRHNNFEEANFENVLNATASVLCLLFSQFNLHSTKVYSSLSSSMNDDDGSYIIPESVFNLIPYDGWNNNEKYEFDWDLLKEESDKFQKYSF